MTSGMVSRPFMVLPKHLVLRFNSLQKHTKTTLVEAHRLELPGKNERWRLWWGFESFRPCRRRRGDLGLGFGRWSFFRLEKTHGCGLKLNKVYIYIYPDGFT